MATVQTESFPVHSYAHHSYPNEAEYTALKRTYLSLLPPTQIIDICLVFEAYTPLPVRANVWPYDLKASIAALVAKTSSSTSPTEDAQKDTKNTENGVEEPPMQALKDPGESSNNGTETAAVDSPKTNEPPISTHNPIPLPPPQHTPYYPYPTTSQPAYPHTPYYPPQQTSYYQQQPYSAYAQPGGPYSSFPSQQPAFPHHPHLTQYTRPPITRPDGTSTAEDMPSYEEMIAEALTECTDPEGAPPKDLFAWMASHYPLQTNFRPSASQALQKAYKRGRLEKHPNGKYRLNVNWDGVTSSRRNARRNQGHVMAMQQNMPPPFPANEGGHNPYGNGHYGYQSHQSQQDINIEAEDVGEGSDAWEAAQNILKAINFGDLFQQKDMEEEGTETSPENMSGPGEENEQEKDRAGLQADLALLAAQLTELAESDESTSEMRLDVDSTSNNAAAAAAIIEALRG